MEKPIFRWAGSAMTGRASRARAEASRVRLNDFMVVRPFIVVGKTQRDAGRNCRASLDALCVDLSRKCHRRPCVGELARENRELDTFIQASRVIVDVFRRQARSYAEGCVIR